MARSRSLFSAATDKGLRGWAGFGSVFLHPAVIMLLKLAEAGFHAWYVGETCCVDDAGLRGLPQSRVPAGGRDQ
eukprot:10698025-Lingulodinium_polyedra.AAC.1